MAIIRILTSISALFASHLRKLTELERTIPIWPPLTPIQVWLNRLFLAPFERWDAEWYIKIDSNGYTYSKDTAQFHPLYPTIAAIFHQLGISPLASLMLVSTVASIILFYFFYNLALLDVPKEDSLFALILFAVSPILFVLFGAYPEGLFLIWTDTCLYWSRQNRWWLASFAGGFAVLTRQQGLFLIFPLLWEYWEAKQRNWQDSIRDWRYWISFLMIPLAMILWIGYRALFLNDLNPNTNSLNSYIYSILISPSAYKVVPHQAFLPPWETIWLVIEKLLKTPDIDNIVNLNGGFLFIILFLCPWPYLRISYRLYSLVIILISFSYYTGVDHPTMGLLWHLILAIPIFIGAAQSIHKPYPRLGLITLSAFGMFFLPSLYILEARIV